MKSLSSYIKESSGPLFLVGRECYFDSTKDPDVKKLRDIIDELNDKYEGLAAGEVCPEEDEGTTLFSTYGASEDDLKTYEKELAAKLGRLARYADFYADIFYND